MNEELELLRACIATLEDALRKIADMPAVELDEAPLIAKVALKTCLDLRPVDTPTNPA